MSETPEELRGLVPAHVEAAVRATHRWVEPICKLYFRSEVRHLERVPDGPTLVVGNHDGGNLPVDAICFGAAWHRHFQFKRPLRVLMHRIPFLLGKRLRRFLYDNGVLPADAANLEAVLDAGEDALLYPGAAREAFRTYKNRREVTLGGRTGFVVRALRRGIPITPVVSAGGHETFFILSTGTRFAKWAGIYRHFQSDAWPLALGVPWGVFWGPMIPYIPLPSKIVVEVLPPIDLRAALSAQFGRDIGADDAGDPEVVHAGLERVRGAMRQAIARLYDERRFPVIG